MRTPSAGALVPRLDAAQTLDRIPATSRPPTLPRYENCWLPLLAKLGAAARGQALPPPDVEWVWIVHLLSPASYIEDCEARYGELIGRADSVRRRRAVTVPRPAPTAEPAQVQAHPPPSPALAGLPSGGPQFVDCCGEGCSLHHPASSLRVGAALPRRAVRRAHQLPMPVAPARCLGQPNPQPACHLRYPPPDMSAPLPAGFASQLSYDIASAVERQVRPQPPLQLLRCRRRRRRATPTTVRPCPAPPQVVFNYQVSLPHYSDPAFLNRATERCAPTTAPGPPPPPLPPPSHALRRLTHRCLTTPTGTRCTCT